MNWLYKTIAEIRDVIVRIRPVDLRCSNSNSDVQFDHAVADDEFPEEDSCPIVQLNTEILETPSFGLLVETADDGDRILLGLPVCPLYILLASCVIPLNVYMSPLATRALTISCRCFHQLLGSIQGGAECACCHPCSSNWIIWYSDHNSDEFLS